MKKTEQPFGRAGPVLDFLLTIATILSLIATAIMIIEGLSRYILNTSYFWAEEMVRFMMVWSFSLTIGIAGFKKLHIRTELLVQKFPPAVQRLCWILSCATGITFALILIYSAIPQIIRYFQMGIVSESNIELPMWLLYLSMPIAGLGLLWYYLSALRYAWSVGDPFMPEPEDFSTSPDSDRVRSSTNPLL
jgi:TRAP-type C4-dicarboxylate transport system permease small subunit